MSLHVSDRIPVTRLLLMGLYSACHLPAPVGAGTSPKLVKSSMCVVAWCLHELITGLEACRGFKVAIGACRHDAGQVPAAMWPGSFYGL